MHLLWLQRFFIRYTALPGTLLLALLVVPSFSRAQGPQVQSLELAVRLLVFRDGENRYKGVGMAPPGSTVVTLPAGDAP